MKIRRAISRYHALTILCLPLFAASQLSAQTRVVVPEGTVIMVRTVTALESSTARQGQTFEAVVADTVRVDNFNVIPAGSRIRGVVVGAQAATRQQSGAIDVRFDRLTLPNGSSVALSGRLTSTDAAERRQIEADPNARVVLVGGRSGVGAAIAGAGGGGASGILGALGGLLSQGSDVRLPAGTPLAVQLESGLVLTRTGSARAPDAFTIYTNPEMIRAAQQALAREKYYRGAITGVFDAATHNALFEYQVDKGIIATGNLDGRTAQSLGLSTSGGAVAVLSADEASLVRRGAAALVLRVRQDLMISTAGRLDTRRQYTEGDVELMFALSAFADNAELYEQLVRVSGNVEGVVLSGRSLVASARRVDAAMQRARTTSQVQSAWSSIRAQLGELDPSYR
ncbi:MAG: peptidoglycan-binding protein [Gemmatimonadaceae bacterium]